MAMALCAGLWRQTHKPGQSLPLSGREWIKDSTSDVTNRGVIIDTMNKDEVTQMEHVKREQNSRPSVGLRKPRQGQGMFSLGGARTHRGKFTWERGCAVRKLKHWMITNGESKKGGFQCFLEERRELAKESCSLFARRADICNFRRGEECLVGKGEQE